MAAPSSSRLRAERDRFVGGVRDGLDVLPGDDRIAGSARFRDGRSLAIDDHTCVRFRAAVIATGSSPIVPGPLRELGDRLPDHRHPVRDRGSAGFPRGPRGRRGRHRDRAGDGPARRRRHGDRRGRHRRGPRRPRSGAPGSRDLRRGARSASRRGGPRRCAGRRRRASRIGPGATGASRSRGRRGSWPPRAGRRTWGRWTWRRPACVLGADGIPDFDRRALVCGGRADPDRGGC